MWIERDIESVLSKAAQTCPVVVLTGARQTGKTSLLRRLYRERREKRERSLFFWRDRTREVDFIAERGSSAELFEAKYVEIPSTSDGTNLSFVRGVLNQKVAGAHVVCRTRNPFPLSEGIVASPVEEFA